MTKAILILTALMLFTGSLFAERLEAIGTVQVTYLNEVAVRKQSLPLLVSISGSKNSRNFTTHLSARLIPPITGSCTLSTSQTTKLIEALKKSLSWLATVQKEGIETTKDIYDSWGLKVQFVSEKGGARPKVMMGLFENYASGEQIIVDLTPDKVRELIDLLQQAPKVFNSYKANEKKADLLR
jgi:hypothetical protein